MAVNYTGTQFFHSTTLSCQGISSLREVSACVVTSLLPSELQHSPLKNHLSISTHPPHGMDVQMVAFIVPHDETGASLTRVLMAHVGRVLPSYCVPDNIVFVRELPTTEHGEAEMEYTGPLVSYPGSVNGAKESLGNDIGCVFRACEQGQRVLRK